MAPMETSIPAASLTRSSLQVACAPQLCLWEIAWACGLRVVGQEQHKQTGSSCVLVTQAVT